MKRLKRWWKALWARYDHAGIIYKDMPFYKCKFCGKTYMNGIFKDICPNCTKQGVEYAIKKSKEST
jgi:rubrerythrin